MGGNDKSGKNVGDICWGKQAAEGGGGGRKVAQSRMQNAWTISNPLSKCIESERLRKRNKAQKVQCTEWSHSKKKKRESLERIKESGGTNYKLIQESEFKDERENNSNT